MKNSKTFEKNPLFYFIDDASRDQIPQVKSLKVIFSSDRSSCYIAIPALPYNSSTWYIAEQHLTIERDIDRKFSFLSHSHFTMCFKNKKLENRLYKIHVYFDAMGNFNNTIKKSVYGQNQIVLETPVELSDDDILQHAIRAQHTLFTIMDMKNNRYLSLMSQATRFDKMLYEQFENKDALKENKAQLNNVREYTKQYMDCLSRMQRYHDDAQYDWHYLERLSQALSLLDTIQSQDVQTQAIPALSVEQSVSMDHMSCIAEATLPLQKRQIQAEKNSVEEREVIDQKTVILEELLTQNSQDIQHILKGINIAQSIRQDLCIYTLLHDVPKGDEWIKRIEYLLLSITDVPSLFERYIFNGDRENVQYMYENTQVKINFLDLFERMFIHMEQSTENAERLMPIAEYFYESSELYRSYAYFWIGNMQVEIGITSASVRCNRLVYMFAMDNVQAFALYAKHGPSPSACHLIIGELGLNALQAIIFYGNEQVNLMPYITILFRQGADINTREMFMGPGDTVMNGKRPATLQEAYFYAQGKKSSIHLVRNTNVTKLATKDYDILLKSRNIIDFSYHFPMNSRRDFYYFIASKCSASLLLREFVDKIKSINFCLYVFPATSGGCSFYDTAKACEANIKRLMKSGAEQNMVHHKTVQVFVAPNPEHHGKNLEADGFVSVAHCFDFAKVLYDVFIMRYEDVSREEKIALANEMKKSAIISGTRENYMQAATLHLAAIIAISKVQSLGLDDYKLLFYSIWQYAKNIEKLFPAGHGIQAKKEIIGNVKSLASSMDFSMLEQLKDTPFFREIEELFSADNLIFCVVEEEHNTSSCRIS